jgi:hypothetical protein
MKVKGEMKRESEPESDEEEHVERQEFCSRLALSFKATDAAYAIFRESLLSLKTSKNHYSSNVAPDLG